ncbi:MAG: glycosyltransferase [Pseudomonadota bacterium]
MSTAPIQISVCIANYNGIEVIDDCIRSVMDQQDAPNVEIIVHDDASTDASAGHIRRHYPDVKLIVSPENVGFCIANNRMAAEAKGEYLLLLNNDAALFPDALATLYKAAEGIGASAIISLPQYDFESGSLLDRGCLLDPFLNSVPNLDPDRNEVGMVIGACFWIDRVLWVELGGLPEWFGSIGEDLYLCCRARLAGHPVRALGASGYRHHVGQSFGGGKVADGRLRSSFRRRALTERNKTFVMAIVYPTPYMQLLLPLHLMLLLFEGMLLSLLQRDTRYLREIYMPVLSALIRQRGKWRPVRQGVQQSRRLARDQFYAVFDWTPYKLRMVVRHGLPMLR